MDTPASFLKKYFTEGDHNPKELEADIEALVNYHLRKVARSVLKQTKRPEAGDSNRVKCTAKTSKGKPCSKNALINEDGTMSDPVRCKVHLGWKPSSSVRRTCGGLTTGGEECQSSALHKPEGSTNWYCFRHKENWKQWEGAGAESQCVPCASDTKEESDDDHDEDDENQETTEQVEDEGDDDPFAGFSAPVTSDVTGAESIFDSFGEDPPPPPAAKKATKPARKKKVRTRPEE